MAPMPVVPPPVEPTTESSKPPSKADHEPVQDENNDRDERLEQDVESGVYSNVELDDNHDKPKGDTTKLGQALSRVAEDHEDEAATLVVDNKTQRIDSPSHWQQGALVLTVHVLFVALTVVTHCIYEWSDQAAAAAWAVRTNESLVEHLKMFVWPWLVLLLPLDLGFKFLAPPAVEYTTTWYLQQIQTTAVLTICQAHAVALSCTMLWAAGVFRLYTWLADDALPNNLPADLIVFLVAVSLGPVWRLWLLGRERTVGWLLLLLFAGIMIGFFTYVTYEAKVDEGFFLDSHDGGDEEGVDHDFDN